MDGHATFHDERGEAVAGDRSAHPADAGDERMDFDAFLRFCASRPDDEKWELWDGVPRRKNGDRQLNPPSYLHQSVTFDLALALQLRIRDAARPFEVVTELGVRLSDDGTGLVPDLMIVPADAPNESYQPRFHLAAEVLSPSNTYTEIAAKIARFQAHPDCLYVLVLEQDRPLVRMRARADGFVEREVAGADAVLKLDVFGFSVPLADIYRRVLRAGTRS